MYATKETLRHFKNDPFLIVKELECGTIVIDLSSRQACTWMGLREEFSGILRKDVLYKGTFYSNEGETTEGFMFDITFPPHRVINGPQNLFFEEAIIWNDRGEIMNKEYWNAVRMKLWA